MCFLSVGVRIEDKELNAAFPSRGIILLLVSVKHSLARAVRRSGCVEKAEAILLRAQAIQPKVAMIAFNLACYTSVAGRMEEAKERLRYAIDLDKDIGRLAIEDEDLKLYAIGSPTWSSSPRMHLTKGERHREVMRSMTAPEVNWRSEAWIILRQRS
jgi:tetratricopeptide (TPR) repeat protein